jgi:hypothetical protein
MRLNDADLIDLFINNIDASKEEAEYLISKYNTDIYRLRISAPIELLSYSEKVLIKEDKAFRTLFYIIALESTVAHKKSNKVSHMTNAAIEYLDSEEKEQLLNGFTFTGTYNFREARSEYRHLMFEDVKKDMEGNTEWQYLNSDHCSSTSKLSCYCWKWLTNNMDKVDNYIQPLISRLYAIRCATVHEGFITLWVPDYGGSDPAINAGSLFDAYPTEHKIEQFNSYESGIKSGTFYKIIKKIIRKYLLENKI